MLSRKLKLAVAVVSLFFASTAAAIPIVTTFNDLNEKMLGAGGSGTYGTFDFEITNNTGFVWTDFHFWDAEPIGIVQVGTYTGPGNISETIDGRFNILALNVGIGETLTFAIDETCGIAESCSLGGAIWDGYPTIGDPGVGVPEPGSLVLLGIGLLGMVLTRKQKNTM